MRTIEYPQRFSEADNMAYTYNDRQIMVYDEKQNYQKSSHDQESIETYFTQSRANEPPLNEAEFYQKNYLIKGKSVNSESQKYIIRSTQNLCFGNTKNSVMEKYNDRQPCYKDVSCEHQTNEDTIASANTENQIITQLPEQQR